MKIYFLYLKLILQPIVENSIVHGLKNKTNNGRIIPSGRIESAVIISVDNGQVWKILLNSS